MATDQPAVETKEQPSVKPVSVVGKPALQASACCSPAKQEVCCEPSQKSSCCGATASSGSCGCQ